MSYNVHLFEEESYNNITEFIFDALLSFQRFFICSQLCTFSSVINRIYTAFVLTLYNINLNFHFKGFGLSSGSVRCLVDEYISFVQNNKKITSMVSLYKIILKNLGY